MAQYVSTAINIAGTSVKQFSSFSLSQGIFQHHRFRLVCPAEAVDGTAGTIFNTSKNWIGSSFSIKIEAIGAAGTLQFSGVVTLVETARFSGHAGDVIISGYSPTILLDDGPDCKTWEAKTLKNIAGDVLALYPQNLLQPAVSPSFSGALPYEVQYKETAWSFLHRLSATYGEWLYYNGQKLVLGAPNGAQASLNYGSNLSQFNMALQVSAAGCQMMGRNYTKNEIYTSTPAGIANKAGLNDFGKHALEKSGQCYGSQPKLWNIQALPAKGQLDDYINTRMAMMAGNLVHFHGTASHPGIQVGGTVTVQGKNVFSQADEAFGDHTVISASHYCDGQGNYQNEFTAVPASVKMPPLAAYTEPYCETQSALVTDNYDTENMGRIRVKFHWMGSNEKSPWIRITSPHGGSSKGMFFIPEVGEEVMVGFEGGHPVNPYVIGTVFNGTAKNENGNKDNDVKVIQTRSGNKIVMNDKDGSVQVCDAKGNDMLIDGKGNIIIQSSESIVYTCGEAKLEMKKDGTINLNGKDITASATNKATVSANTKAVLGSGSASFTADGTKNEANMAGLKANVSGSVEANVSAVKTTISATAKVAAQAPMITLN